MWSFLKDNWSQIVAVGSGVAAIGLVLQNFLTVRKLSLEIARLKEERESSGGVILKPTDKQVGAILRTSTILSAVLITFTLSSALFLWGRSTNTPVALAEIESTIDALKHQLETQQKALELVPGRTELAVNRSGEAVEITCPPGTYMNGISFSIQKGGAHGIIHSITPIYRPFLPPKEEKKP